MLKQVERVRGTLDDGADLPVRGFLCFVDADWPPVGGSFSTRGVSVLWPRKLASLITAPGNLTEAQISATHQRLAGAFPRA